MNLLRGFSNLDCLHLEQGGSHPRRPWRPVTGLVPPLPSIYVSPALVKAGRMVHFHCPDLDSLRDSRAIEASKKQR
jgi:hypothetical protein